MSHVRPNKFSPKRLLKVTVTSNIKEAYPLPKGTQFCYVADIQTNVTKTYKIHNNEKETGTQRRFQSWYWKATFPPRSFVCYRLSCLSWQSCEIVWCQIEAFIKCHGSLCWISQKIPHFTLKRILHNFEQRISNNDNFVFPHSNKTEMVDSQWLPHQATNALNFA